jgi:hypothetical protein
LNGDGLSDVAVANGAAVGAGTLSLLLNSGNGRFLPRLDYLVGRGFPPQPMTPSFQGLPLLAE